MAGFITHLFFSLPQEEEKNLKKIFDTATIFDIIQIIYIYLLHANYSPQGDLFSADLPTG